MPTGAKQQSSLLSVSGSSRYIGNCPRDLKETSYTLFGIPTWDTRLQVSNNVYSTTHNQHNMTIDNILSYHLQKLQEVGYRDIQIVNSADMTLNLANAQTNQTIATVPAKLVEMTYSTNSAPNETRRGYFILTATNATAPNLGTTKGYSVFYEGNSTDYCRDNKTLWQFSVNTIASTSQAGI